MMIMNIVKRMNMFFRLSVIEQVLIGSLFVLFLYDLFDSPHQSAFQSDLDAVRMVWGFGKDTFYHTPGQFTCTLVLF